MLEKIEDILFRCFLISFAFLLISLAVYLIWMPFFMNFLQAVFHVTAEQVGGSVLYFYGWIKVIAIFIFFVPALAIRWHLKDCG